MQTNQNQSAALNQARAILADTTAALAGLQNALVGQNHVIGTGAAYLGVNGRPVFYALHALWVSPERAAALVAGVSHPSGAPVAIHVREALAADIARTERYIAMLEALPAESLARLDTILTESAPASLH
jgi:hypothetical protein